MVAGEWCVVGYIEGNAGFGNRGLNVTEMFWNAAVPTTEPDDYFVGINERRRNFLAPLEYPSAGMDDRAPDYHGACVFCLLHHLHLLLLFYTSVTLKTVVSSPSNQLRGHNRPRCYLIPALVDSCRGCCRIRSFVTGW